MIKKYVIYLIVISLFLLPISNAQTVSHQASEIVAGSFGTGDFTFQDNLYLVEGYNNGKLILNNSDITGDVRFVLGHHRDEVASFQECAGGKSAFLQLFSSRQSPLQHLQSLPEVPGLPLGPDVRREFSGGKRISQKHGAVKAPQRCPG